MASIFRFPHKSTPVPTGDLALFLQNFSVEVMPRTAAKIKDFRSILPKGTRVYIAQIAGTQIDEMLATAKRISDQGFAVMPHIPARLIADKSTLENWVQRYGDIGISQALLLAGGVTNPEGEFCDSMQLL